LIGCFSNDDVDEIFIESENIKTIDPCENGMAGIYPYKGYDLLAQISLDVFSAESANDIWGWTDVD